MNFKRTLPIVFASFILLLGVVVSLILSSFLLWGEMEARLYTQQSGERSLALECPLMIAPGETGAVRTVITNSLTDEEVKPQVNAFISHEKDARVVSQTLQLEPLESQSLEWTVDGADVIFQRLILVNILQRPFDDLASRQEPAASWCSVYLDGMARAQSTCWLRPLFYPYSWAWAYWLI
jgi:hypothetical protein